MQNTESHSNFMLATTKRRLIALIYDGFLLIAVLFIAIAVLTTMTNLLKLQVHQGIASIYLLLVCFMFYGWFWTHGGQTLGMRTWRIQLVNENNGPVSWQQCLLVYLTALPAWLMITFGLTRLIVDNLELHPVIAWLDKLPSASLLLVGVILLFFDHRPANWRDRFSQTRVIRTFPSSNAA